MLARRFCPRPCRRALARAWNSRRCRMSPSSPRTGTWAATSPRGASSSSAITPTARSIAAGRYVRWYFWRFWYGRTTAATAPSGRVPHTSLWALQCVF